MDGWVGEIPKSQTSLNSLPPATTSHLFYQYLTVLHQLKVTYTDIHIFLLKTASRNCSSCNSSVPQNQLHPLHNTAFSPGLCNDFSFLLQQRKILEHLLKRLLYWFTLSFTLLFDIIFSFAIMSLTYKLHSSFSSLMCKTVPANYLQN